MKPIPQNDTNLIQADSIKDSVNITVHDSLVIMKSDSARKGIELKSRFLNYSTTGSHKDYQINNEPYHPFISDWILAALFLCLLFFTWLKYWNANILRMIVNAFSTRRDFQILLRESINIPGSVPFSINLIYTLSVSLMVFVYSKDYFKSLFYPEIQDLIFFSICFASVFSIFGLKIITTRFLGSIFKIKEISSEYQYNKFIYRVIASIGLILILVLYFSFSSNYLKYATVIFVVTMYFISSIKGIFIILDKQNTSLYYIILYFCTLEILPMVVLAKLVSIYM